MSECEMYLVRITDGITGIMCGNCGELTLNLDAAYCPKCGSHVESVQDDGDSFAERMIVYAHDTGFDEGYQAAFDEVES